MNDINIVLTIQLGVYIVKTFPRAITCIWQVLSQVWVFFRIVDFRGWQGRLYCKSCFSITNPKKYILLPYLFNLIAKLRRAYGWSCNSNNGLGRNNYQLILMTLHLLLTQKDRFIPWWSASIKACDLFSLTMILKKTQCICQGTAIP